MSINNSQLPICDSKYSLRLKFEDNQIKVYPCCAYEFTYKLNPLGVLNKEDILSNNTYNKLLEFYSRTYYNNIVPACFNMVRNNTITNITSCNWNSQPLSNIAVCISQACNLKCKMCKGNNPYSNNGVNPEIDELYFLILNQLKNKNINTLHFTQEGEPFFYKTKMFNYLNSLIPSDFNTLYIISNLTLLNNDDINQLINLKNNNINIQISGSIDGITEATYSKIRNNNLFNKVINTATVLANAGILKCINYVVQRDNLHELDLVEDFWRNINQKLTVHFMADSLNFNEMSAYLNNYYNK